MGRSQKAKGNRSERELAKLLGGERVPLSGSVGGSYSGDVMALGLAWEAKVRRDGFKTLYKWLEGRDALAIKADRKPWLAVIPVVTLLELLNSTRKEG